MQTFQPFDSNFLDVFGDTPQGVMNKFYKCMDMNLVHSQFLNLKYFNADDIDHPYDLKSIDY